ncbi:MAG: subtilisin-like proprotein convertase family protein [Verrucomicrobiales bacterium]|jgi:subtilisin-like proprotein convertase family protein
MKSLKSLCLWSLLLMGSLTVSAPAVVITQTFSFTGVNLAIPDGSAGGTADIQTITPTILFIDSMTVDLNISGSYNGDLYVYLQHGTGLSILLNRVGQSAGLPGGFDNDGFSITLDDAAASDVHGVDSGGGLLSGAYQPDGRDINPFSVLDTDARLAPLSVFNGSAPSGDWTLFLADLIGTESHTLDSWSLTITGDDTAAVPEPRTALPILLLAGMLIRRRFTQA